MKPDQQLFLRFLRTGLWNEKIEYRLRRNEFLHLVSDARKQAVRGLVGHAMLSSELLHPKIAEKVQNTLFSIARQNMKMDHIVAESVSRIREEGIEPVLLKGQGVASYYHEPFLRESGDIDLYVKVEDAARAFDSLLTLDGATGVAGADGQEDFSETEKHRHLSVNGIIIEVHRFSDVLPREYDSTYQGISDSGLGSNHVIKTFEGVEVRTPEPTFNAFYIFLHLWRHFVAVGVGFRQVCDWAVLLRANAGALDMDRLRSWLESLDLMRPWKVFGQVAVEFLGLPGDCMPFLDASELKRARKVVRFMMREGNFGHEREDRWSTTGNRFLDTAKVFFLSTFRYCRMFLMFGKVAFREYKSRIYYYICKD